MPEVKYPSVTVEIVAHNADGSILHVVTTEPNQVTTTGQPTLEQYTDKGPLLAALATWPTKFPILPPLGTPLQRGERYRDGSSVVEVRQSHTRTADAVSSVPALFLVARAESTLLEWVAQEKVEVGRKRAYGGKTWEAIQAHVTQTGWEPPNVQALWREVTAGVRAWASGTYALDAEVTHAGSAWRNRRANNNQGFAPGATGSGWMQTPQGGVWYNLGNEGYPAVWEITHKGRRWRSPSNANFWEPGVALWVDIGAA
jgi:hypothetical protein